jgi:hypothetical protein
MIHSTARERHLKLLLGLLLGVSIASPVLLGSAGPWHLPAWLGALLGLGALIGALGVLWRQGATRGRYVACFVAALAIAAFAGWYWSEYF